VLIQSQLNQVDVLWVVDNSSSMGEEQAGIADNFPVFLDFFTDSGLDWHIGVISTDMEDSSHRGRLQGTDSHLFVDPFTPDPEVVLAEMTTLGIEGSGDERGRDPIWLALTEHADGPNEWFYRNGAAFHVIVISDEEDSSDLIEEEEWLSWMAGLKWGEHQLSFSSIVAPDPICEGANDPGVEYIRYTERLGGIYWPICDQDWAQVLELLGIHAVGLEREFFLSTLPVPETIEVTVTEFAATFAFSKDDWEYSPVRNSITFHEFDPRPGNVITIDYDVLKSDLD
jgi:hypothetical protein